MSTSEPASDGADSAAASPAADRGTSSSLTVAGRKIELLRGGSGPPLLLLHSAGGEMEWSRFHELLGQHFTVLSPAHPGFSFSEGLDDIRTTADYAWHTLDLLDALAVHLDETGEPELAAAVRQPVPVAGFSLGGWIAAEAAILRPQRFSHLVLTCPAGLRLEEAPYGDLFSDDLEALRSLLFFNPDDLATVEQALPLTLQDSRLVQWLKAREATARVAWNPYLHNPRLHEHLHRIPTPTLLLWGEHDRLIPPALAQAWLAGLPVAELRLLPEAGHMVPFEQPEAWAAAVAEFLSSPR